MYTYPSMDVCLYICTDRSSLLPQSTDMNCTTLVLIVASLYVSSHDLQ